MLFGIVVVVVPGFMLVSYGDGLLFFLWYFLILHRACGVVW